MTETMRAYFYKVFQENDYLGVFLVTGYCQSRASTYLQRKLDCGKPYRIILFDVIDLTHAVVHRVGEVGVGIGWSTTSSREMLDHAVLEAMAKARF